MRPRYEGNGGWATIVGSAALGAAAMFMLDPDKGKRRRALARDKATSVATDTRELFGVARRDAAHRLDGLRARARRLFTDTPVPDDLQLIERVRARMGRLVSHPHAIQVGAYRGRVTLSGPVLEYEVSRLLDAVRSVWGVSEVENRLVVYDSPESISSLQGGAEEHREEALHPHESWPPAVRVAALAGGTILSLYGMRERSPAGVLLLGAGLALALRGATNRPLRRFVGLDHTLRENRRLPIPYEAANPLQTEAPAENVGEAR
jgi:hypothetical protein